MHKMPLLSIITIIAIALMFLFLGHAFVLQRTLTNTSKTMTIGGDTNAYVSMIEGNWITTQSPFKFRMLVPFLASLLPFSPTDSLKFISYISLFFCYIIILLTCTKLGLNTNHSMIGVLSVWSSTFHLYYYHNPFLTDAFGLLMLCVMIFALFSDSFFLFIAAALLGILTRETTIFLVPVWLVKKDWQKSILLIATSVIVLLIPRYFLSSEIDATLISVFNRIGVLKQPLMFVKKVYLCWGFVWFFSIIGIWYVPIDKFVFIVLGYISLLCGAVFTSLIATDTGRMFSILTPVLAITSAQLYSVLINKKMHLMALTFVVLVFLQAFVSIPNVIFGEGSWVFDLPRKIFLGLEILFVVSILVTHHNSLQREVIRKTTYLFENRRKPFSHID